MRVRDPWGERWRVSRRWYLWRPRAMEIMQGPEIPTGRHDDPFEKWAGHPMARGNAAFVLTGLPAATIERLLLLVLMPVALLARLVGLPWTVVVRQGPDRYRETSVRGWAASAAVVEETAEAIGQGHPPPRTIGACLGDTGGDTTSA